MKIQVSELTLPHFNDRPEGCVIDTVVIHAMCSPVDGERAYDIYQCVKCLDDHKVSSHYSIDRDGGIWRHVQEDKRAWHAGVSKLPDSAGGRENVNDFSIGVELIGALEDGFTDAQYTSLTALTVDVMKRHPIVNFVGHDQISPGRKLDPGPKFDWKRYLDGIKS